MPIAHNEGNYFADSETLKQIEDKGLVALRYHTSSDGNSFNPNGSINNIAAILSDNGKVLGMMPHPERYVDNELGGLDGFEFLKRTLEQLS